MLNDWDALFCSLNEIGVSTFWMGNFVHKIRSNSLIGLVLF